MYEGLVKRWLPRRWTLRVDPGRAADRTGEAAPKGLRGGVISVPPLVGPYEVAVFLHEVGHVRLGHFEHKLSLPEKEFQAEKFAQWTMVVEGLTLPAVYIKDAKAVLRGYVRRELEAGKPVPTHIIEWCGYKRGVACC